MVARARFSEESCVKPAGLRLLQHSRTLQAGQRKLAEPFKCSNRVRTRQIIRKRCGDLHAARRTLTIQNSLRTFGFGVSGASCTLPANDVLHPEGCACRNCRSASTLKNSDRSDVFGLDSSAGNGNPAGRIHATGFCSSHRSCLFRNSKSNFSD